MTLNGLKAREVIELNLVVLCPRSQSLELREQDIHSNANAKREFIASSSQGPSCPEP